MSYRTTVLLILVLLVLVGTTVSSCQLEGTIAVEGTLTISVNHSGCNGATHSENLNFGERHDDCLIFDGLNSGPLVLTHVNAAFNCCPDQIIASIERNGSEIRIIEEETSSDCDCLCLYTLEIYISNLEEGVYTIIIEEPYRAEGDEPLQCVIDTLQREYQKCCVERTNYPWL